MRTYCLYYIVRFTCFVILKICCRLRIYGRENVPRQGSFIVASNHSSYLDPPILGWAIPQVLHFMARDNLFTIPIFGRLLRCIAAYSVKRGQQDFKAIKESLKLLKEGSVIAIFPEGTRILGSRFGQAHLGVGMLAAHSGVPVVPVFIKGSEAALPKGTCLIRIRPIEAYIGKPIRFEECAPGEDKKQAYERFGQTLMKSIELLSKKDI